MDGVIVGVDEHQEWLLPWWWKHYQTHNNYPVHFFDFGMSEGAKKWCEERGSLSPLSCSLKSIAPKEKISSEIQKVWSQIYVGDVWQTRGQWFKKPLACENSPFRRTIWLDTDCQVLGSIAPLFDYCKAPYYFAAAAERKTTVHIEPGLEKAAIYNSGVLAFTKHSPLIPFWNVGCHLFNDILLGDQSVLSYMIHRLGVEISQLPIVYNCNPKYPEREEAQIIHWVGFNGKAAIIEMMLEEVFKPID